MARAITVYRLLLAGQQAEGLKNTRYLLALMSALAPRPRV